MRHMWQHRPASVERLEKFHRSVAVRGRHLAQPLEAYARPAAFQERNLTWIDTAVNLGEAAVCDLLDGAGLPASEIGQFMFTTVTGIAVPSIDARLMNRIPFSSHLKRAPLFGLGCVGGAAGVARLADYLRGHPQQAGILLSVELCSLTLQHQDLSVANLVASGLFGDGAAAVLMVGGEHPLAQPGRPRVVASRSVFFPETEHVMGWDVQDSGFKVVLSADVSEIAGEGIRPAVEPFLHEHGLELGDIHHWIAHPGGPKVIQALEEGLGLDPQALALSRESLAEVGNLSSASVLWVLDATLERYHPPAGSYGMLLAMGPAFCAELVLLQW